MWKTNSPLGWPGRQYCCFNHGLISFFSACAARSHTRWLPRSPVPPVCRPAGASTSARAPWVAYHTPGRPGAPPAHTVQLAQTHLARWTRPQCGFDTFLNTPHTHALDGRAIDIQRRSDGVVGPPRPSRPFVRLEQDASTCERPPCLCSAVAPDRHALPPSVSADRSSCAAALRASHSTRQSQHVKTLVVVPSHRRR
jgi:hypothetical protein